MLSYLALQRIRSTVKETGQMKATAMNDFSRRAFISGTMATSFAATLPTGAAPTYSDKGKVRFLAFADIHFRPGLWPHGIDWLNRILARAEKVKTDFTIQLGDFVHRTNEQAEIDYVKRYNTFSQPTYHVLGNHDGEVGGLASVYSLYGLEKPCYFFDRNGYNSEKSTLATIEQNLRSHPSYIGTVPSRRFEWEEVVEEYDVQTDKVIKKEVGKQTSTSAVIIDYDAFMKAYNIDFRRDQAESPAEDSEVPDEEKHSPEQGSLWKKGEEPF